jgi:hypothetical protein
MPENDRKSASDSSVPLAGDGGVVILPYTEREPYEALDDLMSVVEAFSPEWPARGISGGAGKFLL